MNLKEMEKTMAYLKRYMRRLKPLCYWEDQSPASGMCREARSRWLRAAAKLDRTQRRYWNEKEKSYGGIK